MELFLVKLVALLRPLTSIEYVETLFAVLGVGLFAMLLAAVLVKAALHKSLRMSAVDGVIVAFTIWCVSISFIYYEGTQFAELAKLLIPFLSYTLVKNVIPDESDYKRLLFWIIVGFSVPTIVSAVLILTSNPAGSDGVMYWTQETRWKGAYFGSHDLGHSMTLFMITLVLYATLRNSGEDERRGTPRLAEYVLLGFLGIAALYCLYMSQVRSAILGLLIFATIYLYCYNKKLLMFGAIGLTVLAVVTLPFWFAKLLPEFAMRERGINVETMDLGSGRPNLWLNDILVFAERPIDAKLAGAGIGNRSGIGEAGGEVFGHNDWLDMLTQTGLIGLALFAILQILIFKKILRMEGKEKYAFLSLFIAVNLMMFVSNSYAWRIRLLRYHPVVRRVKVPLWRELFGLLDTITQVRNLGVMGFFRYIRNWCLLTFISQNFRTCSLLRLRFLPDRLRDGL
jgi:O-antigen ligase